MPIRDSQTVVLSRQSILLVAAVGVGLLTLSYVLGVQVGKQSAALHRPLAKGAGEELEELPATIVDQIKALDQASPKAAKGAETRPAPPEAPKAPEPSAPAQAGTPAPSPVKAAAAAPAAGPLWTLQLVSTPDGAEAKAVLAKVRAAGFKAETVSEKGLFKVRLTPAMERKAADASMARLRNHGFKPFAVKVE